MVRGQATPAATNSNTTNVKVKHPGVSEDDALELDSNTTNVKVKLIRQVCKYSFRRHSNTTNVKVKLNHFGRLNKE